MKVGGTASITAITQIVSMVAIGYGVEWRLDWGQMNSLFLGVILWYPPPPSS
jgi:CPA2 family monovalent cation:H+ antiporter-2